MKNKNKEYEWVLEVIHSCKNKKQLKSAERLTSLFNQKYLDFRLELMLGDSLKKRNYELI
jgi:hypothetical protein